MKKVYVWRFVAAGILLLIFYWIWPLPFWYFSKKVLLPTGEVLTRSAKAIASPFVMLGKISNLDQDNKNLEQDNLALNAEIARLKESVYLNAQVSKETIFFSDKNFQAETAMVVGRSADSFNQKIVINKGQDSGFKVGSAVLSQGYLIGKISSLDSSSSTVQLVSAHDSKILAMTEKGRVTGIVQGGLEGLTMTDLPAGSKVDSGENVLTSNLGGEMPSGIIIGKVAGQTTSAGDLFLSAKVDYPINISSVEIVSVLK